LAGRGSAGRKDKSLEYGLHIGSAPGLKIIAELAPEAVASSDEECAEGRALQLVTQPPGGILLRYYLVNEELD